MNGIFREIFVDDCLHIFCVDDFEIFKVNGGGNKKEEVFDKIRQIKGNKLKQKEIEVETLDFESQVLNVIGVDLVNGCNLACKYCYLSASSIGIKKLSENKFLDILNFLHEEKNHKVVFVFSSGGENTLNFDLMKKIPFLCRENGFLDCSFDLITNGTIFTNEMIDFFKSNNFTLHISLDGDKKTNDKNRVYPNGRGSYDDVYDNLCLLKENGLAFSCNVLLQFDSDNVIEVFQFFEENKIHFNYDFPVDSLDGRFIPDTSGLDQWLMQFETIMDFYKQRIENNCSVYADKLIKDIKRIHFGVTNGFACNASIDSIHIGISGSIYPCSYNSGSEELCIGTIYSGLDYDKIVKSKLYAKQVDCYDSCRECWIKYLCSGGCFGLKWVSGGETDKPTSYNCMIKKSYWEAVVKLYIRLSRYIKENSLFDYNS